MLQNFIDFFSINGSPCKLIGDALISNMDKIPVRNGIPRFIPDISYSTGNFSKLRAEHARLQLDSVNGTEDRYNTILSRTKWPPEFFKGKTILECGCGAGPDSEVLLLLGAKVLSVDLAGLDIAKKNIGENPNHCLVQANIIDLPLLEGSFDIVFCHRVIQHTPDPEEVLKRILKFVKKEGAVFVHSYADTFYQVFRWKYLLRPITKRVNSQNLYRFIKWYSPFVFKFTKFLNQAYIGRIFCWILIPYLNYSHFEQFKICDDDWLRELAVHDTFDALSPQYDIPLSATKMREIASQCLSNPFVVKEEKMITLLRTIV